MVKSCEIKIITARNLTFPLIYLIFVVIVLFLSGCDSKVASETSNPNSQEANFYNIPKDFFDSTKYNNDEFLGIKSDAKSIYSWNFRNSNLKEILKSNNNDKFIHTFVSNSKWIIWVEDESLILDTQNKPFKWELIAKNTFTGEQIVVDKTNFTRNDFVGPQFINFTPYKLAISDGLLVYCKTSQENDKIFSQVNCFDLNTKQQRVIVKSKDDVTKEWIVNCCVFENNIVYSKYRELNDQNFTKRQTQYVYSDLFIYDLKKQTTTQLTENAFFDEPNLFGNNLVAIEVPENKPIQPACESNVVLMNIQDKKIKTIVDVNSSCYTKKEEGNLLYRTEPSINSKFISWKNIGGQENRYIYNYVENRFVEIYKKKESESDNIVVISKMYDNLFIVFVNGENNESNTYCIEMKNLK